MEVHAAFDSLPDAKGIFHSHVRDFLIGHLFLYHSRERETKLTTRNDIWYNFIRKLRNQAPPACHTRDNGRPSAMEGGMVNVTSH